MEFIFKLCTDAIKCAGDQMSQSGLEIKCAGDKKNPEIKCSRDQMCQSYLEIKCAGDQKFRGSNVPEITCSGDQMFRRSKIPEIEYSGDQMCQVLMEIINSRRSSVFGDQVCVSPFFLITFYYLATTTIPRYCDNEPARSNTYLAS